MKTSKGLGAVLMINAAIFFSFVFTYFMSIRSQMVDVLTVGSETVGLGSAWVESASGLIPYVAVVGLGVGLGFVIGASIYKGTFNTLNIDPMKVKELV